MVKDTHTIILIIVSSEWSSFFFPELFIMSHFLVRDGSSFLFRSSKFSALSRCEAPSNHCKASPCVFNFSFFLSSFYYQSSSWWLYRVVREGFLSFFICSSRFLSELRSAKIYSKINMVPNTCFVWGVQAFFILHSEVQFFLPSHLRWCYVILHNLSSYFMIHMLSRMRYLKSINLFIGVILGYISPKTLPKDCCYFWCS